MKTINENKGMDTDFDNKKEENTQVRFAGFWIRGIALFIDEILVLGLYAGIIVPLGFGGILDRLGYVGMQVLGYSLIIGLSMLYFTVFVGKFGAGLGKLIMGLRIVNSVNYKKISYGTAFGRYWASRLSLLILCIGYIAAVADKEKASWHDGMCNTRVINIRDKKHSRSVMVLTIFIILLLSVAPIFIFQFANGGFNKDIKEYREKFGYFDAKYYKIYKPFVYRINSYSNIKTVTVTSYYGEDENINIPETINGIPVTTIDFSHASLFELNNFFRLNVPKTVTLITPGYENFRAAFYYVKDIFVDEYNNDYSDVDGVLFNKERTEIVYYPCIKDDDTYRLPDGLIKIPEESMASATFKELFIPDSVRLIEINAFIHCDNLEFIQIGNNVDLNNIGLSGNTYSFEETYNLFGKTGGIYYKSIDGHWNKK